MLIRYKKNFEKIAMGLLSFMPDEKDVKQLVETIKEYETNKNWQLYLWKEEDDILGVVGLILKEQQAIVQHLAVNPSHRNRGIAKEMLNQIQKMYEEEYDIIADHLIEQFYDKYNNN